MTETVHNLGINRVEVIIKKLIQEETKQQNGKEKIRIY